MTTVTIAAVRLEPPASNPAREEFMRRLSEHEDALAQVYASVNRPEASRAELLEAFRMTRRAVVAAYDQLDLRTARPDA